jgi:prepilin-type N-terminal cleavage/methylation domain-containing protein
MKTATGRQKTEDRRRKTEAGRRNPVSRITHHASRIASLPPRAPRAFTLIELLVVVGVIAVLAGLTFPAVQGVKRSAIRTRAGNEMAQVETAIERFQQKLGYYPPDNAPNWASPPLYYELLGTTNVGTKNAPVYVTLDGSAQIKASDFLSTFGPGVTGFVNCNQPGRGDDVPGATAFVTGFKPGQFMAVTNGVSPAPISLLGSALDGPLVCTSDTGVKLNPWRYNSSSPRYNPKTYDLWIDVKVGDQTNRICNWSAKPLVVGAPYP